MNTVEADPSSTSYRFKNSEDSIEDSKSHSFSLLSPERSLKFDLLLHLIANLAKPIVLCGPDGIGKTTFLHQLSIQGPEAWTVCYLESTPKTTFESILQRLGEFAASNREAARADGYEQNPSDQLKQKEEDGRILVLLLDDAGLLMPGILKAVCEFAQSNRAIRPVFSMRPDHLHVKTATDFGLDDCHIVDLPPLTEEQCLGFLQEFSAEAREDGSVYALSPAFVQRAYRESHGIPGQIIRSLPKDNKINAVVENAKYYRVAIGVGVVSVLTIAGASIFLKSFFMGEPTPELGRTDAPQHKQILDRPRLPAVVSDTKNAPTAKEQFSKPLDVEDEVKDAGNQPQPTGYDEPNAETKLVKADKSGPISTGRKAESEVFPRQTPPNGTDGLRGQANDQEKFNEESIGKEGRSQNSAQIIDRHPPVASKPLSTVATSREFSDRRSAFEAGNLAKIQQGTPPQQPQSALIEFMIPGIEGAAWLLAQNPNHWTLQLIVVNRLNLLRSFAAEHSDLGMMASFGLILENKAVFRVFYGTFPTLKEAKSANEDLPVSLRQSWPRRFKLIHEEINSH